MPLRSVCVFCGSKSGVRPAYSDAAAHLGRTLATRGIRLVYGGAHRGLMGILADACLAAGGHVTGVIPRMLVEKEIAHRGLTEQHVVETMHERKALMADQSEVFIALPGGFGTFDELFEILTWRQIGLHSKPLGFLNVENFFDPLLAVSDHAANEGFLAPGHRNLLITETDADLLLNRLAYLSNR